MARARHAKPSGLLARLLPGRTARREAARRQHVLLRQVAEELRHLRALADAHAAAAASAEQRAREAQQRAREAEQRAGEAEQRAAGAEEATAALFLEVVRLREEVIRAWAEGRLPAASLTDDLTRDPSGEPARDAAEPGAAATVIDLREAAGA